MELSAIAVLSAGTFAVGIFTFFNSAARAFAKAA